MGRKKKLLKDYPWSLNKDGTVPAKEVERAWDAFFGTLHEDTVGESLGALGNVYAARPDLFTPALVELCTWLTTSKSQFNSRPADGGGELVANTQVGAPLSA